MKYLRILIICCMVNLLIGFAAASAFAECQPGQTPGHWKPPTKTIISYAAPAVFVHWQQSMKESDWPKDAEGHPAGDYSEQVRVYVRESPHDRWIGNYSVYAEERSLYTVPFGEIQGTSWPYLGEMFYPVPPKGEGEIQVVVVERWQVDCWVGQEPQPIVIPSLSPTSKPEAVWLKV